MNDEKNKTNQSYMGVGIAIGVAIGAALGVVTGQTALMGAGIAIGVAIGAALQNQHSEDDDTE